MIKERLIDLEEKQLKLIKKILKCSIPGKTVWAYGSRVTWKANESSDLDLAVFGCDSRQIFHLKESFEESNLLISVDVMDWEKIPEKFKTNIKEKYVVLQEQTLEQNNKIQIQLSKEHGKYIKDVEKCFSDLNVKVTAGYVRKSIEELPMQIFIFLAGAVTSGVTYDLLKAGIKKALKKFRKAEISIKDKNQNTYNISSKGQMNIFLNSNRKTKVISNIKTVDDLFKHLQAQTGAWQKVKLKDVVIINPSEKILKGSIGKKVLMDNLIPFKKKIFNYTSEKYKGGSKFRNGDTIVARITPCLENGKTAFVDILNKNEVGFGSTEFIVLRNKPYLLDKHFLFYFSTSRNFRYLAIKSMTGSSGRQRVQENEIMNLELLLPPLKEQQAIAETLSSLDDKIELLHKQNKTLEDTAQTLFHKWFIEDAKDDWETDLLGNSITFFDSKRVPLSKMQRDKMKQGVLYPYYGAATVLDYINEYIFDGEYILLGEDGTVRTNEGYPVLQYATGKFWVNNHAHIFEAKSPYTNFFIWLYLLKKNIDKTITGAVQPKINQTNLKNLDFPKFPINLVNLFNKKTDKIFQKIKTNKMQIHTLIDIRKALLPNLMSGKIQIKFYE